MKGLVATVCILTILTACGPRVSGAVGEACMAADRQAASRTLCACVQRAANATLNGSDQARVATFFEDPEIANDTRISDTRRDERFWDRFQRFTRQAEQSCR